MMVPRTSYREQICPEALVLAHPEARILLDYTQRGCLVNPGTPWTCTMMEAAITKGPHPSTLHLETMEQLQAEVEAKQCCDQSRVLAWDIIRDPPCTHTQLKISPIAMITHKSQKFCAILDLSFEVKLTCNKHISVINDSSIKTAPADTINQLDHSLSHIIHVLPRRMQMPKSLCSSGTLKMAFRSRTVKLTRSGTFVKSSPNVWEAP